MSLRPFVYWAQTENDIFLKVDVKKVQGEPDVSIEEEEIEFTARGVGSQGNQVVKFCFFQKKFINIFSDKTWSSIVEFKTGFLRTLRILLKVS